ncbi:ATP-binding protein [Streptomyces pathocidini]|uniref:ATP-binding protein n=1 Tax=Streptomyces pathocidini TaxID=1650571 RepID=A0ABW7UXL6_9ACTN|nr:ATP-binding protein [Streptomyces pathocidini]
MLDVFVPDSYTLFCPPLDTSPGIARDFVANVLRARNLTQLVDAAALCTSEVATNAYLHARGVVRVTVYDGVAAKLPAPQRLTPDLEGGRGLTIVDALTEGQWGTTTGAPLGLDGLGRPDGLDGRGGPGELGGPGGRDRPAEPVQPDAEAYGLNHPKGKGVWFSLPLVPKAAALV